MPTRKTPSDVSEPPIDLSEYQLDDATRKAVMAGPAPYNKDVDPELRAKLAQLKREGGSSPFIMRVAPPSVAAYVPPTELPSTSVANDGGRAEPKVEVDLPSSPADYPTQPSLQRLEGEPDVLVPGVVKRAGNARTRTQQARPGAIKLRSAVLAVLAVLVPVVLVIIVMGRIMRQQAPRDAAPPAATSTPTAKPSALPSATMSAVTTAAASSTPVPSAVPSTAPSATASGAVHGAPRQPHHTTVDDPYDAAAPTASPAVTVAPQATTAPHVTAVPTVAPPVAPTTKGPTAPVQKPEF